MIFKAADDDDAVESADFVGKKKFVKPTWDFSHARTTSNYSEQEEHRIEPYELRDLREHACLLVHCERAFERMLLPPHGRNAAPR